MSAATLAAVARRAALVVAAGGAVVVAAAVAGTPASAAPRATGPADAATRAQGAIARLPLAFEVNRGQHPAAVRFAARAGDGLLALRARSATLTFAEAHALPSTLRLRFPGARRAPAVVAEQRLPGRVSYLSGARRVAAAATYRRVRYRQLWRGIDVVFYGSGRELEYDLVVAAGADPGQIRLAFDGHRSARLDAAGDLVLTLPGGRVVRERAPVAYQLAGGRRTAVASRFVLAGDEVRIALGAHDATRQLVVDPVLTYGTYLGGSAADQATALAVDAAGNAYVTGSTASTNFSAAAFGLQPAFGGGGSDAFVTKLDPSASAALYSTYLGGAGADEGLAIAVDAAGAAVVTGGTSSTSFPTTDGAPQRGFGGGAVDAFVAKLDPSGTALEYATYLGGPGPSGGEALERGTAVALADDGSAYVTGGAYSGFPTTPGAFAATVAAPLSATFAAKLDARGELSYSTLVWGDGNTNRASAIAVDAGGHAHVAGLASAIGTFPTTAGAYQPTAAGNVDAFVAKLAPDGSALAYSTLLGGQGFDEALGLALDDGGRAIVVGQAGSVASGRFPTTADAIQPSYDPLLRTGNQIGFVAILDASGSALDYATFVGGRASDRVQAVARGPAGSLLIAGETRSPDFPVTAGAVRAAIRGTRDGFVAALRPGAAGYAYASYSGTAAVVPAIAGGPGASALIAGAGASGLATPGALKTAPQGQDAYVARFDDLVAPPTPAPLAVTAAAHAIGPATVTLAGSVDARGSATAYVFEYGPSTAFGAITAPAAAGAGSGAVAVSAGVAGLAPDTTYLYRLVATSPAGTAFGAVASFRTAAATAAPVAQTLAPGPVGGDGATLRGAVDPGGQPTAYVFEYGTTTAFGAITTPEPVSGQAGPQAVAIAVGGLAPGTTYLVRLVATNAAGTSMGPVVAFTTAPAAHGAAAARAGAQRARPSAVVTRR